MARAQILVVEDENIISMQIREMLKTMGYSVCGMASSGQAAVDKAEETRPDLVLMDVILMGPMDGIEAAGHICACLNVPVIFLTGCADDETSERARKIGSFAYLTKPFTERELDSAIKITLQKYMTEGRGKDQEEAGIA